MFLTLLLSPFLSSQELIPFLVQVLQLLYQELRPQQWVFNAWSLFIINHLYLCYGIINFYIDGFHYHLYSFVENSLCPASSRVSKENAFITFCIKFSKVLPIIQNVTLASKHSEVLHPRLLSIPNFISNLLCSRLEKYSITNVT